MLNKPKYKAVVARGFNGLEQITVEVTGATPEELGHEIGAIADHVFQPRADHYQKLQEDFENITREKMKRAQEEEAAFEAKQAKKKKDK